MRIRLWGLNPPDLAGVAASSVIPDMGASFRLTLRLPAGPSRHDGRANQRSVAALRKTHTHPTGFRSVIVTASAKSGDESDIWRLTATVPPRCGARYPACRSVEERRGAVGRR